ncbi:MAG: T3SS effector HopA1 family protein [Magnetospirillum sp. WYHS-4]
MPDLDDFKLGAKAILDQRDANGTLALAADFNAAVNEIYRVYVNNPVAGRKVPLADSPWTLLCCIHFLGPLRNAMVRVGTAATGVNLRIQTNVGFVNTDGDTLADTFNTVEDLDFDPPDVASSASRYMHFRGQGHGVVNTDWRVGINVRPASVADAVAALLPLTLNQANLRSMKFLGPGNAGKLDTVVVYLHRDGNYANLRQAIVDAVTDAGLALQNRKPLMWNGVQAGIFEGGEPPAGGGSFGKYRSKIAMAAYLRARAAAHPVTNIAFSNELDAALTAFGIDPANPWQQVPPPGGGAVLRGQLNGFYNVGVV